MYFVNIISYPMFVNVVPYPFFPLIVYGQIKEAPRMHFYGFHKCLVAFRFYILYVIMLQNLKAVGAM